MQREFFRVEHTGDFKGHFSNHDFTNYDDAVTFREETKGLGNVEYWNEVYNHTRIVKVTEIIEEIVC